MGLTPRTRNDLDNIPLYVAGKTPTPRTDIKNYKLSSNESPFEPLPAVLEALKNQTTYNIYPEPFAASLREKLATMHDVNPTQILTGCGGLSLIYQVCNALVEHPSDEVIFPWRSFEAYPIAVQAAGGTAIAVPLTKSHHHDLTTMLESITDNTKLIILCSPNNPTGTTISSAGFEEFMHRVPQDIAVFLDEAYYEFVEDAHDVHGEKYLERYPNLMTLRTFSKAYGLAGLRIGYLITSESLAAHLSKMSRPFEVSAAGLLAAKVSLEHRNQAMERVHTIAQERQRVIEELRQFFDVSIMPDSQGNFIWVALGTQTDSFVQHLHHHGITARPYGHNEGVRITISTPEANDVLIAAVASF